MAGSPHSDDLRRQASRCFFLGWGYKRTAAFLDLSPYTVRDWFRTWRVREDVDPGALPSTVSEHPAELREYVRSARRGGMSWTELEALFHVPRRTLRSWCRDISGEAGHTGGQQNKE